MSEKEKPSSDNALAVSAPQAVTLEFFVLAGASHENQSQVLVHFSDGSSTATGPMPTDQVMLMAFLWKGGWPMEFTTPFTFHFKAKGPG